MDEIAETVKKSPAGESVDQGWIPIAESMQRERVLEFAERLARVAAVNTVND